MDFIHKLSFDAKSLFILRVKKYYMCQTPPFSSRNQIILQAISEQGEYLSNAFLQLVHQFFTQSFSFIPVAVYIRHYRNESPVCSIKLHKKKLI